LDKHEDIDIVVKVAGKDDDPVKLDEEFRQIVARLKDWKL